MKPSARRRNRETNDLRKDGQTPGPAGEPPLLQAFLIAFMIFAVVLAVFYPCLQNGFTYDDRQNIVDNRDYRGLGLANLRWMFTTFHMGHYQPLSWMTLGLDYLLWGMNPWGYHLTNLLLHAANAVLVFFLSLRFFDLAAGRNSMSSSAPSAPRRETSFLQWAAAIAALLFALHPLRVESVAWVTERRDVLSSFFLLATVWLYLRAHSVSDEVARRRFGLAAIITYLLSLLSRAIGVTFPFILLVLDVYPLRRLGGSAGPPFSRKTRPVWLEKIPYFVLAVLTAIPAPLAQKEAGAMAIITRHSIVGRIAQAFYGLVFYLSKSLLPIRLSPYYELHLPVNPLAPRYFVSAIVVAVAAVLIVASRRRLPALAVVAACHVLFLLPVLGFLQSGMQEVADRYSYLPSIGWAVLVAAIAGRILADSARRSAKIPLAVGLTLVLVTLGVLTWRQCSVWKNNLTLWRAIVENGPRSAVANYTYGIELTNAGDRESAINHYHQAIDIFPGFREAHHNLANCLSDAGRLDEAITVYLRELELNPQSAGAYYELGRAYEKLGRFDDAVRSYRDAIRVAPRYLKPYIDLGAFLVDHKKAYEEALTLYHQALKIEPNDRDLHYSLAIALEEMGKPEEAVAEYRESIRIDSDSSNAHVRIGNIRSRQGRVDDAIAEYQAALRIAPDHPHAKANLDKLIKRQSEKPGVRE